MEITTADFDQLLKSGQPFMVDFWAEWCGPCRMIAPIVDEAANEYDGRVAIRKCNVDHNSELPARFSVRNIPTLLCFKGGEMVQRHVGALSRGDLKNLLDALL